MLVPRMAVKKQLIMRQQLNSPLRSDDAEHLCFHIFTTSIVEKKVGAAHFIRCVLHILKYKK